MTHKIKLDISEASLGHIWLDGKEISVTEFAYKAKAGNMAEVTIKMIADVEGDIEITKLTNAA